MSSNAFSAVESILLVIAHPDDESMFFSPLLQVAADTRRHVSVLCLSTGDYDGLGKERRLELVAACALFGIEAEEVRVLDDPRFRDGMHEHWAVEEVERVVLKHLLQRTPDMIATFDDYGVSGHPNHIAVSEGVVNATRRYHSMTCSTTTTTTTTRDNDAVVDIEANVHSQPLLGGRGRSNVTVDKPILGVVLESTSLWRKYMGPFDLIFSLLQTKLDPELLTVVNSQPRRVYSAMATHYTQFVWFRRLFICFSRFTFVNTFRIFHNSFS